MIEQCMSECCMSRKLLDGLHIRTSTRSSIPSSRVILRKPDERSSSNYLRERFRSSKHKDDTYQKFNRIRQYSNGQLQKISITATDLLRPRSRLPQDTISDYSFIQRFFTSMPSRLRQDVETQYTGDEDSNTVIAMAARLHSIHRSTGAYGKERYDKQPKKSTQKKSEHKPKKKFNKDGNPAEEKE